jgi:single-strand DNA-binding protein
MPASTTELPPTSLAISGNLARDPELSYSAAGRPWCRSAVAITHLQRGEDGSWQDSPAEYVSVVCFGQLAENVAASLHKGDRIVAKGRFEEEHWTGKDGTERSGWKLVAEDVGASLAFHLAQVQRPGRRQPAPVSAAGSLAYADYEEPF